VASVAPAIVVCLQLTAAIAGAAWLAGCRPEVEIQAPGPSTMRAGLALAAENARSFVQDFVQIFISERLHLINDDGRPNPRLAERWGVSEDGLTWTLTLRPGVKYHDGTRATASSLMAAIEEGLKSPGAPPVQSDIAGISAPDDCTLVVRLRTPSSLLLDGLQGIPLMRTGTAGPVGTGPFLLESSTNELTVMRAFKDYYQGPPAIDRFELRVFPTVRAAWAAMMRGEIDVLFEVGREAVEFVEAESSVQVYSFTRPYIFVLWFNLRRPALAHPDVRQALSLAVDREAVVRSALRGRGRAAEGYIWPNHWAYDRTAPSYRFDREAARLRLSRAGLPGASTPGRPRRLALSCLIPSGDSLFEAMALVVQRQLFDVGIDLEVEATPLSKLVGRLAAGDYDTFMFQMASQRTLIMPYQFLRSPAPGSPALLDSGYTAADTALDRLRQALSDDEVRAAIGSLQRVLYDDPPGVFIAWEERARAVSRRFFVPSTPGRDIISTFWQIRPAAASGGGP
jgi:peptide/nickel transport system substrate-binding protein